MPAPVIPNSADRRAWLRSFHYYRAQMMESPAGAEALALCQPLIEAEGGWTPVMQRWEPGMTDNGGTPPKDPNEVVIGASGKVKKPSTEEGKTLPPPELVGTPAAIHHGMPFFKEGRVFADPWRLPEKPKRVLKTLVQEALATEDADLMIPEPEVWNKWTPRVGETAYGIGSLRGFDFLRSLRMAGILSLLDRESERTIIWQIGPNAVLARALKKRLPNATLVMTCDAWEMVSAVTFLKTAEPDADVLVTDDPKRIEGEWAEHDFILFPRRKVAELTLPRLDLAFDAMSLELLTPEDVDLHARRTYELGTTFVFGLRLDGESPAWPTIETNAAFERYYWLHLLPAKDITDWHVASMIDEGFVGRGYYGRPEEIKHWKMNNHFWMGWRRLKT